jgi:stage III sporulation protein AB
LVVKLFGAILLIGASFSVGYYMAKSLSRRRDFLKEFIVFMNTLATEIRYNSEDIFTLVQKCAKAEELQSFGTLSEHQEAFENFWNKSVLTVPKAYSLKKEDISLLFDFGSQLGKTDVDGQLKHIELYKIMFEKQLANAENEITQKSKLYKTMGLFVGTAAALIMI